MKVCMCMCACVCVGISDVELRTHTIRDRNRPPLILGVHAALSSLNRIICAFNNEWKEVVGLEKF